MRSHVDLAGLHTDIVAAWKNGYSVIPTELTPFDRAERRGNAIRSPDTVELRLARGGVGETWKRAEELRLVLLAQDYHGGTEGWSETWPRPAASGGGGEGGASGAWPGPACWPSAREAHVRAPRPDPSGPVSPVGGPAAGPLGRPGDPPGDGRGAPLEGAAAVRPATCPEVVPRGLGAADVGPSALGAPVGGTWGIGAAGGWAPGVPGRSGGGASVADGPRPPTRGPVTSPPLPPGVSSPWTYGYLRRVPATVSIKLVTVPTKAMMPVSCAVKVETPFELEVTWRTGSPCLVGFFLRAHLLDSEQVLELGRYSPDWYSGETPGEEENVAEVSEAWHRCWRAHPKPHAAVIVGVESARAAGPALSAPRSGHAAADDTLGEGPAPADAGEGPAGEGAPRAPESDLGSCRPGRATTAGSAAGPDPSGAGASAASAADSLSVKFCQTVGLGGSAEPDASSETSQAARGGGGREARAAMVAHERPSLDETAPIPCAPSYVRHELPSLAWRFAYAPPMVTALETSGAGAGDPGPRDGFPDLPYQARARVTFKKLAHRMSSQMKPRWLAFSLGLPGEIGEIGDYSTLPEGPVEARAVHASSEDASPPSVPPAEVAGPPSVEGTDESLERPEWDGKEAVAESGIGGLHEPSSGPSVPPRGSSFAPDAGSLTPPLSALGRGKPTSTRRKVRTVRGAGGRGVGPILGASREGGDGESSGAPYDSGAPGIPAGPAPCAVDPDATPLAAPLGDAAPPAVPPPDGALSRAGPNWHRDWAGGYVTLRSPLPASSPGPPRVLSFLKLATIVMSRPAGQKIRAMTLLSGSQDVPSLSGRKRAGGEDGSIVQGRADGDASSQAHASSALTTWRPAPRASEGASEGAPRGEFPETRAALDPSQRADTGPAGSSQGLASCETQRLAEFASRVQRRWDDARLRELTASDLDALGRRAGWVRNADGRVVRGPTSEELSGFDDWFAGQMAVACQFREAVAATNPQLIVGFEVGREEAADFLRDRPVGTFILRFGSCAGSLAISLKVDSSGRVDQIRKGLAELQRLGLTTAIRMHSELQLHLDPLTGKLLPVAEAFQDGYRPLEVRAPSATPQVGFGSTFPAGSDPPSAHAAGSGPHSGLVVSGYSALTRSDRVASVEAAALSSLSAGALVQAGDRPSVSEPAGPAWGAAASIPAVFDHRARFGGGRASGDEAGASASEELSGGGASVGRYGRLTSAEDSRSAAISPDASSARASGERGDERDEAGRDAAHLPTPSPDGVPAAHATAFELGEQPTAVGFGAPGAGRPHTSSLAAQCSTTWAGLTATPAAGSVGLHTGQGALLDASLGQAYPSRRDVQESGTPTSAGGTASLPASSLSPLSSFSSRSPSFDAAHGTSRATKRFSAGPGVHRASSDLASASHQRPGPNGSRSRRPAPPETRSARVITSSMPIPLLFAMPSSTNRADGVASVPPAGTRSRVVPSGGARFPGGQPAGTHFSGGTRAGTSPLDLPSPGHLGRVSAPLKSSPAPLPPGQRSRHQAVPPHDVQPAQGAAPAATLGGAMGAASVIRHAILQAGPHEYGAALARVLSVQQQAELVSGIRSGSSPARGASGPPSPDPAVVPNPSAFPIASLYPSPPRVPAPALATTFSAPWGCPVAPSMLSPGRRASLAPRNYSDPAPSGSVTPRVGAQSLGLAQEDSTCTEGTPPAYDSLMLGVKVTPVKSPMRTARAIDEMCTSLSDSPPDASRTDAPAARAEHFGSGAAVGSARADPTAPDTGEPGLPSLAPRLPSPGSPQTSLDHARAAQLSLEGQGQGDFRPVEESLPPAPLVDAQDLSELALGYFPTDLASLGAAFSTSRVVCGPQAAGIPHALRATFPVPIANSHNPLAPFPGVRDPYPWHPQVGAGSASWLQSGGVARRGAPRELPPSAPAGEARLALDGTHAAAGAYEAALGQEVAEGGLWAPTTDALGAHFAEFHHQRDQLHYDEALEGMQGDPVPTSAQGHPGLGGSVARLPRVEPEPRGTTLPPGDLNVEQWMATLPRDDYTNAPFGSHQEA